MQKCSSCGEPVSDRYVTVRGINGVVNGCPNCDSQPGVGVPLGGYQTAP